MTRTALVAAAVTAAVAAGFFAQPARRPGTPGTSVGASKAERRVPYAPGESLTYDISWSGALTAGTATMTVLEKRPSLGSVAYRIVAEGRPTPLLSRLYTLYYKAESLVDVHTLLPQQASVYSEEGRRRRTKTTRFDHAARTAQYEVTTATIVKTPLAVRPDTLDVLSAVYYLRSVPLEAGRSVSMTVADGGRLRAVEVAVGPPEVVATPAGSVRAWRLRPAIQDDAEHDEGWLSLWISTDARRLPLRMEAVLPVGTFTFLLRSAGK